MTNELQTAVELTGGAAVRCSAWLAVFFGCFTLIGIPIGLILGVRIARRKALEELGNPLVDERREVQENRLPRPINGVPQGSVFIRLLLLEIKLLLQQTLLKIVGHTTRNPRADQSPEQCSTNASKKDFVCHKRVMTANDPSSATASKKSPKC